MRIDLTNHQLISEYFCILSPNRYHNFRIVANEWVDIKGLTCVLVVMLDLFSQPSVKVYISKIRSKRLDEDIFNTNHES